MNGYHLERLVEGLSEPEQAGLRRASLAWLRQALLPARLGGVPVPAVADLSEPLDEGRAEGLKRGLAQGEP